MYNILLVEDEPKISSIVIKYLQNEGYSCSLAENGFDALEMFSKNSFHLIILDVMLPGIDGFEILSNIREFSDIPVIMLTARQGEIDRIKGFAKGADDYVIKPFSPRELVSRVRVFLKRVYNFDSANYIQMGPFRLYPGTMKLEKNEKEIELTSTEFKLISVMLKNKNQYLSRDQLIELAFGSSYDGTDRSIDSYIKRIRQKIEDNPKEPVFIKSKYGYGYMFGGIE